MQNWDPAGTPQSELLRELEELRLRVQDLDQLEADRERGDRALRNSEHRLQALAQAIPEQIAFKDTDGRFLFVNERFAQLCGLDEQDIIGKTAAQVFPPELIALSETRDCEVVQTGQRVEHEIHAAADGGNRSFLAIEFPIPDETGKTTGVGQILSEISDPTLMDQGRTDRAGMHDPLTSLASRGLFADRLDQALRRAKHSSSPFAMLLLDLNRFTSVNEALGHAVGDAILKETAERLLGTVRDSDMVARLGSDEFGIIVTDVTDLEGTERIAKRVMKSLRAPYPVDDTAVEVGASIGVALFPDHAEETGDLMQRAEIAMRQAQEERSGFAVYNPVKDQKSLSYLTLTRDLREAIEQDQLSVHFQPKIDLLTSTVRGLECLSRWQHPSQGFIPPDEFIALAEQTGLINKLTPWVFNAALAKLAEWQRAGLELQLSVNLSARTLHDDRLPELVADSLKTWGVEPHNLILEITESAIMIDPDGAFDVAEQLRQLGVLLSVDDFGTGQSSLAYLKRFPLHELKIDKSFVMQMTQDENDAVIVSATIDLAHNLGLQVTAEGVETEEHASLLKDLGCDVAQGYFFSRPLPADEMTDWLGDRGVSQRPRLFGAGRMNGVLTDLPL